MIKPKTLEMLRLIFVASAFAAITFFALRGFDPTVTMGFLGAIIGTSGAVLGAIWFEHHKTQEKIKSGYERALECIEAMDSEFDKFSKAVEALNTGFEIGGKIHSSYDEFVSVIDAATFSCALAEKPDGNSYGMFMRMGTCLTRIDEVIRRNFDNIDRKAIALKAEYEVQRPSIRSSKEKIRSLIK